MTRLEKLRAGLDALNANTAALTRRLNRLELDQMLAPDPNDPVEIMKRAQRETGRLEAAGRVFPPPRG